MTDNGHLFRLIAVIFFTGLPQPASNNFCRIQNPIYNKKPHQNRMKRTEAQRAHLLIQDSRLSGGGFLIRVRRNKEIRA